MARLIDADRLLGSLHEVFHDHEEEIEFSNGIDFAMGLLNEQTTIDVSDLKEIFEIVMPVVKDYYEKVLPIVNEQLLQQFAELQEKETAKKPIYDESYDGLCPNCKNMAFRDVWWYENNKPVNYSHCHFCGQKIDWTEDEEVNENE